jgi:hypothetical protein
MQIPRPAQRSICSGRQPILIKAPTNPIGAKLAPLAVDVFTRVRRLRHTSPILTYRSEEAGLEAAAPIIGNAESAVADLTGVAGNTGAADG